MNDVEVRRLGPRDQEAALLVINEAARWYQEFLPPDELHDPEMTPSQWAAESSRMMWYGAFADGRLVGVVGLEYARDAALLRHAYVLADHQRHNVGTTLLDVVEADVHGVDRIVAGTYRQNYKARRLLEKRGFLPSDDPIAVLRTYYDIPEDRLRSSLTYEKRAGGGRQGDGSVSLE